VIADAVPGSIFAGKYKIEKVIGAGGMGVIFCATHMQLEQRVAIKLLTSGAALDPERVGRFAREAKAAARIHSEHVVRILDYGTHASGAPFIVMEHLVGSDLAMAVKTRGGLPVDEAIDYMIQACDGVAEAHAAGIVHRDLKPSNLVLTRKKDGTQIIKVLDFGASKLTAECSIATSDLSKTDASALIGSPRYMAPEQLKAAHEIDSRADIFALGATLFELLAGEPVFRAESISRLFTKILWDAPPSILKFRDDVPAGLDALVFRCLEKAPDDRYQTVKELVEALAEFAPARSAALVVQIGRLGRPPASIAPPPRTILKRQLSADGEQARTLGERPPEVASPGSKSMSTMAVLRAAQVDGKGRRVATLVGVLVAALGLVAAVLVLVVRSERMAAPQPSPRPSARSVAPADTLAASIPPVSPQPAVEDDADAGPGSPTAIAPRKATSSIHAGHASGATVKAPPAARGASTTTPTGALPDFGARK
jgi:serine/threonine-protein kinase